MSVQISWTLDSLVEAYKHHQRRTRGLREQTLQDYQRFVRPFVRVALGGDPFDPASLSPSDVVAFIASMSGRFSPRSMKHVRTALRSFFRFLRVEGLCDERMEAAIPTVAHWRLSALPRCLSDLQLEQVLTSFDTSTPCGHRDRAMVLCLASLGLRPGELAELRLEDFEWRRGTIELRTRKSRRGAILPLPHKAGEAIVAYLADRSPQAALATLVEMAGSGSRIAILGDMLELGKASGTSHRKLGNRVARYRIDRLYLLGKEARRVRQGALLGGMEGEQVTIGKDHRHIARMVRREARRGDWLLCKGSRGMKMEKVLEALKETGD